MKSLNPPQARFDRNPVENKAPYQSDFNRKNKLQNFPYNTTWKDGQPNVPPTKNVNNKATPNPLFINVVNMVGDPQDANEPIWCVACQLPRAPKYCTVALSCSGNQTEIEEKQEHEGNNDDVGCNMFDSCYEHSDYEDYDKDVNEQRQFQNEIQQQVFSDESDIDDDVCNMLQLERR